MMKIMNSLTLIHVLFFITFGFHTAMSQLQGSVKMGCFKDYDDDSGRRVMGKTTIIRNLTLEKCRNYCMNNNREQFTYFGTEYYYECYCSNDYATLGSLPESSCDTYCEGNKTQMCGGDRALSVYTDIDECSRPGYCNQNCTNTLGGYQCSCYNSSYRMSSDMKTCEDIDECQEKSDNCNQICMNHVGWFSCKCKEGFDSLDNEVTCTDINECEASSYGGCSHRCNNTVGSYLCQCPQELVLDSNGKTCIEPGALQSWQKAIIGACVGGALFIIIVVVVVFFIHRKRKEKLKYNNSERETEVIRNGNQRLAANIANETTPQTLPVTDDLENTGNDTTNPSDPQFNSNPIPIYEDIPEVIENYEELDISARHYDNQSALDRQNYTPLNLH